MIKEKLKDYLPIVLQGFEEIDEAFGATEPELNLLHEIIESCIDESMISTASLTRIEQWEERLGLDPSGTLEERRAALKINLAGAKKLSEESIKEIVKAVNNKDCKVTFVASSSLLRVGLFGDLSSYAGITDILYRKKPAHIALEVGKYYRTWSEVKETFPTWGDIKSGETWQTLLYGE